MNTTLLERIKTRESQILEFKFEINDARKIAETVSAFSNTNGGSILIGVKDNGSIAGVRSTEEYYMIQSACELYCKPIVEFEYKQWNIDNKEVLEIIIKESNAKPIMALNSENKYIAYFRNDASNYCANPVMITVWKDELNPYKTSTYTKNEETVLRLFEFETELSLSRISNQSKLKYKYVIETVAQLIKWSIIKPTILQGKIYYSLV